MGTSVKFFSIQFDKSNFLSSFFFLDLTRIFLFGIPFEINNEFNMKYFCSLFFFYVISSSMQTNSISFSLFDDFYLFV